MFRGDWIRHAAAGLVTLTLILGPFGMALLPSPHTVNVDRANGAQQQPSNEVSDTSGSPVLQSPQDGPTTAYGEAGNKQGPRQSGGHPWAIIDTLAQIVMAVAAVATVILLWRTIRLTKNMLEEARDMSQITRDIGSAQVRCYPSIQGVWLIFKPDQRLFGLDLEISFANSGNSPVRNVQVFAKACQQIRNVDAEPTFSNPEYIYFEENIRIHTLHARRPDIAANANVNYVFPGINQSIIEWIFGATKGKERISPRGPIKLMLKVIGYDVFDGEWYIDFEGVCQIPTGSGRVKIKQINEADFCYTPPKQ